MNILEDIVNYIKIQDNFAVAYLDDEPLELPDGLLEVIQKLPKSQQHKYLGSQIRNFIYNRCFKGDNYLDRTSNISLKSFSKSEILENNRISGRDWEFYQAIHTANSGTGYWDSGWEVLKVESEASLAVKKQGLTLYIEPKKHLETPGLLPLVGNSVSILMPKNLLEQGYYLAVSNCGLPTEATVCIYFNLDSGGAIALMQYLTETLNTLQIPFCWKLLSDSESYWRYDSGMLIVRQSDYRHSLPAIHAIHEKHQSHFSTPEPIFTKILLPGISIAETPLNRANEPINFGMHRCQLVAQGLLNAWLEGDNSPAKRMQLIRQSFDQAQISWDAPYLNPQSQDIY
jgi:hypothetical protein